MWSLEFDTELIVKSDLVLPPQFKSLMIYGDYLPAHPFALCLSQLSNEFESGSPILITAQSRSNLIETLKTMEMVKGSGRGQTSSLLSKLRIFYPETPHHWLLVLSLLHMHSTPDTNELRDTSFVFDSPVSMVILHEPGTYFSVERGNVNHTTTMNHYLRLITAGLACTQSFQNKRAPPLIVFESRINQMKLPILALDKGNSHEGAYIQTVLPVVERYFDWTCEVAYDNELNRYVMNTRHVETESHMMLH